MSYSRNTTRTITPFFHNVKLPFGFEMQDKKRLRLAVTREDESKFDALPKGLTQKTVWVKDLTSGFMVCLSRSFCGANCFCAAEVKQVKNFSSNINTRC